MSSASPFEAAPGEKFIVPCDLVWFRNKPLIGYVEVTAEEIQRSFLFETVDKHRLVDLRPLDDVAPDTADVRLCGMIFMTGRCGSTLLARLLSAVQGVYVLREPRLFVALANSGHGTPAERARWLRHLAAAFCCALQGRAKHMVIKWTPFMTFYASAVAAAFPGVPALFLFRDAVEVLVSLCDRPLPIRDTFRPEWISPDLRSFVAPPCETQSTAELMAIAVASFCDAARAIEGLPLLDYRSLPEAAWTKVAPHFGITVGDNDRRRMMEQSKSDAKKKDAALGAFVNDALAKHSRADETLRELARRFVEPRLERLKSEHRFL